MLLVPGCWLVPESCPGDVIIIIRLNLQPLLEIGRASCRERVCLYV